MYSVKKSCTVVLFLLFVVASVQCSGSTSVTTGGGGSDTTPPIISNPLPTGQQTAGTSSVLMRVTTDENATCRYSVNSGSDAAYTSLPNTFTTTGTTAHAQTINGLTNGGSYSYYVRCRDASGNDDTTGTHITWSVAAGGSGTATLTWDASPVDASHGAPDGYRIYHSAAAGGTYALFAQIGTALTYTATNLSSGTHCFAVSAYNAGGESAYAACSSGDCCKTIP
jgi:hypothetical protein